MRIVYLGTPDFAVKPLLSLIKDERVQIVGVVTNCDKPVGRKQILTPPPVKVVALENNIPVYQYNKIRLEGVQDLINLKPDLMITCAFGQILSQEIIDIPKLGVINIHASLLPLYRGASPIHYAILNGEEKTGVTIMKTDIGIDTGDILLKKEIAIQPDETCGELFERLSDLGAIAITEAIDLIFSNRANFYPQDNASATYSKIIKKEMARIDWKKSAVEIKNQIRAFNPAPVAYTTLNGEPFKIYQAEISDFCGNAGEIISSDKELIIGCGKGALSLKKVQKSGGKPLLISDFLRGNKLDVGTILE